MVTDRHSEDVRGEVAQRGSAVAGSLRVDHPVALPNRRVDQVEQVLAARMSRNLARKRMDKASTGTRKSTREGSQRLPASSIPPPGTT